MIEKRRRAAGMTEKRGRAAGMTGLLSCFLSFSFSNQLKSI
jgi:hypothetical protein